MEVASHKEVQMDKKRYNMAAVAAVQARRRLAMGQRRVGPEVLCLRAQAKRLSLLVLSSWIGGKRVCSQPGTRRHWGPAELCDLNR